MSSDNWTTCPRCAKSSADFISQREKEVVDMYGTSTIEEFDLAREKLASLKSAPLPVTFREDYEFYGAEEGQVTADYRGSCKECGLSLKFQHSVAIDIDGT